MQQLLDTALKYKKVLIGIAGLVVIVVLYNIFILGDKQDQGALVSNQNQSVINSELGREIVATLNRLKSIDIDPEFFEDPVYTRLLNFSVEIDPQPVGKTNPFKIDATSAVIGGDGEDVNGDTTTQTDGQETGVEQVIEETGGAI